MKSIPYEVILLLSEWLRYQDDDTRTIRPEHDTRLLHSMNREFESFYNHLWVQIKWEWKMPSICLNRIKTKTRNGLQPLLAVARFNGAFRLQMIVRSLAILDQMKIEMLLNFDEWEEIEKYSRMDYWKKCSISVLLHFTGNDWAFVDVVK